MFKKFFERISKKHKTEQEPTAQPASPPLPDSVPKPTPAIPNPLAAHKAMLRQVSTEKKSQLVSIFKDDWLSFAYEEFIAIDIETTGLSKNYEFIVEVAAIRYKNGAEVDKFVTLIDPGVYIEPGVTAIHGISNETVIGSPIIDDVMPALLEFLGNSLLVGHNANFDVGFIEIWARKCGFDPVWNYIDTISVAKKMMPGLENYKQQTVLNHMGYVQSAYHRAEEDCRGCAEILNTAINSLVCDSEATKKDDDMKYYLKFEVSKEEFKRANTNAFNHGIIPDYELEIEEDDFEREQRNLRKLNFAEPCVCVGNYTIYNIRTNVSALSSNLCVALDDKPPFFQYPINRLVHACGLSKDGRYAAFQTANGKKEPAAMLFFEVLPQKLLWEKSLPTGWKSMQEISINPDSQTIDVIYRETTINYDFNGEPKEPQSVQDYYINYGDPYDKKNVVDQIIEKLIELNCEDQPNEEKVIMLINKIGNRVSEYQLSHTLKKLGGYYVAIESKSKALTCYKLGRKINDSLSVKKKINQLENEGASHIENMFAFEVPQERRTEQEQKWSEESHQKSEQFAKIHNAAIAKIDIEKLKAVKASDNLDLNEIELKFLERINKQPTENPYIAGYFTYEHKLNYQSALKKLISSGYLELCSVEYALKKAVVADLKSFMQQNIYQPDISGKKAELIERILVITPKDILENEFACRYFAITEKGKALLPSTLYL